MRFIAITIACALIGIAIGSVVGITHKALQNAELTVVNNLLNSGFWR